MSDPLFLYSPKFLKFNFYIRTLGKIIVFPETVTKDWAHNKPPVLWQF